MKEGESFGEIALLEYSTRTATIVALEDLHLFKMDKVSF